MQDGAIRGSVTTSAYEAGSAEWMTAIPNANVTGGFLQAMLPVVREQRIAYVVGGMFCSAGPGTSNETSPFQLALKGPLAAVGAVSSDERLIKLAKTTGISIAALTCGF